MLEKRPKAAAQSKLSVKLSGDDRVKKCNTLVTRSMGQLVLARWTTVLSKYFLRDYDSKIYSSMLHMSIPCYWIRTGYESWVRFCHCCHILQEHEDISSWINMQTASRVFLKTSQNCKPHLSCCQVAQERKPQNTPETAWYIYFFALILAWLHCGARESRFAVCKGVQYWGWNWMIFKGPFQLQSFPDSMIYLGRHAPLQNRRFENTLGRAAAPYIPSGENWSLSNTVMQSTSCSRSLMKNWQLEFHFGLRVSCIVLVMWHWEPIVTSQYGLLFPGKMETNRKE